MIPHTSPQYDHSPDPCSHHHLSATLARCHAVLCDGRNGFPKGHTTRALCLGPSRVWPTLTQTPISATRSWSAPTTICPTWSPVLVQGTSQHRHRHDITGRTGIASGIATRWRGSAMWPSPIAVTMTRCRRSASTTPLDGSTRTHKRPSSNDATAARWAFGPSRWTQRRARKRRTWTLIRMRWPTRMYCATSTPSMRCTGERVAGLLRRIATRTEIAFRIAFARITIGVNRCHGQCRRREINWNCRYHRHSEGHSQLIVSTTTLMRRRDSCTSTRIMATATTATTGTWRCNRSARVRGGSSARVSYRTIIIVIMLCIAVITPTPPEREREIKEHHQHKRL